MTSAGVFAAMFAALYAAHMVADHWVQRDCDAANKGLPGWPGRLACGTHVATYIVTQAVAVALVSVRFELGLDGGRFLAGLAVSAVTHYVIDRRSPLRWLADLTGHGRFYQLGAPRPGRDDNPSLGTGAYALDQSAHIGCLFAAALIIT